MRKQLALASLAVLAAATATPARADVVIGPRVSYYFDNSNLRTSGIDPGLDEGDALDPADIASGLWGADLELHGGKAGVESGECIVAQSRIVISKPPHRGVVARVTAAQHAVSLAAAPHPLGENGLGV